MSFCFNSLFFTYVFQVVTSKAMTLNDFLFEKYRDRTEYPLKKSKFRNFNFYSSNLLFNFKAFIKSKTKAKVYRLIRKF